MPYIDYLILRLLFAMIMFVPLIMIPLHYKMLDYLLNRKYKNSKIKRLNLLRKRIFKITVIGSIFLISVCITENPLGIDSVAVLDIESAITFIQIILYSFFVRQYVEVIRKEFF